jgi:hypothetical protein
MSDEAKDLPENSDPEARAEAAAEHEEAAGEPEDPNSPQALARRVAALGEEDEADVLARREEEKLAARRAKMKKGKKGGLDAAASKRLAKIGAKSPPKRAPVTAVDADPLLEKTQEFTKWAKKNRTVVASVVGLLVLVALGFSARTYFENKKESDASVELAKAVADERGRIGDPDKEVDPDRPKDPRPVFKTTADLREAALKQYREVETKFPGTGAAFLARLSEGSLLLDKHEPDGAIAAFNDAKASPLAQADAEVKGRALEGLGFAYELKAQLTPADSAKNLDDALKYFRELENTDVKGFKELGMYHQARVYEAKGDKDRAKELLKSLHERVAKPGEGHPFPYLEVVTDDRLRAIDPTALPQKQNGALGGPGGGKMSEAQMKALIEQLQKNATEHPEKGPPK